MKLVVEKVDTWVASIEDEAGGLAAKLQPLAQAGAHLEVVIARRAPERPGTGVVFITPLKGAALIRAAQATEFKKSGHSYTLRVEGPDKPGEGARIAQALAEKGLNLHGFSAIAIQKKFVAYLAFDTAQDATTAARVLRAL